MAKRSIKKTVIEALEDLKGVDIRFVDVRKLTDVTDGLVIATGTSSRHVRALAENVVSEAKQQGFRPIGEEGRDVADWVLVDFGDLVVHVMLAETRSFYDLERLWSNIPADRSKAVADQEP